LTDEDLAYLLSYQGAGKGHYWNTFFVDIGKGKKYQG